MNAPIDARASPAVHQRAPTQDVGAAHQTAAECELQQDILALTIVGGADEGDFALARLDASGATRNASTPAISSPMKVREEPVTPCTIEMLPASRLDSWASDRVGRKSDIRRSFRRRPDSPRS